jgi:site-specific DNA-cytosine methylase
VGNTLTARMHKGINTTLDEGQTPIVVPPDAPVAYRIGGDGDVWHEGGATAPLTAGSDRNGQNVIVSGLRVRRLMPIECERLQGFPDNYTRIPVRRYKAPLITRKLPPDYWDQNEDGTWTLMAPDAPRYIALGNSWAVPCARWIGQRIAAVDAIVADHRRMLAA